MATHYHGKYGQVLIGASAIASANHWDAEEAAPVESFDTFGGGGWMEALGGNSQLTGTVSGKWDFDLPPKSILHSGSSVSLLLYRHRSSGPLGRNNGLSFTAVIGTITETTDTTTGGVGFSFTFTSSGTVTKV